MCDAIAYHSFKFNSDLVKRQSMNEQLHPVVLREYGYLYMH